MQTLYEILKAREAELDAVEAELKQKLQDLRIERAALERAVKATGVGAQVLQPRGIVDDKTERVRRAPKRASERTIKTAVVDLLKQQGHGMTALDILDGINASLNVDYPRTSLSPQLSRLKSEGWLDRDGVVWFLTEIATELEYPSSSIQSQGSEPIPRQVLPKGAMVDSDIISRHAGDKERSDKLPKNEAVGTPSRDAPTASNDVFE